MKTRSATLTLFAFVAVLTLAWAAAAECPPCGWVEETAWAEGCRYNENGRGNWAMFTCLWETPRTIDLIAGQHFVAGTVTLDPSSSECEEGEVEITITLNPGWRFADVPENVKIQDYSYEDRPSGNPAPGQFDHKFDAETSPFSVCVPTNCYYGIHVNVERCVLSNNFA